MFYLKCTNAVLSRIQLKKEGLLVPAATTAILGNWYIGIFQAEDRNAFIYMSDKSLLTFILLEGQRNDPEKLSSGFLAGLIQLLGLVDVSKSAIDRVISDYGRGALTGTDSQSFLGSLTNYIQDYRFLIDHKGGLKRCSIGDIILQINATPNKRIDFSTPIEATRHILQGVAT